VAGADVERVVPAGHARDGQELVLGDVLPAVSARVQVGRPDRFVAAFPPADVVIADGDVRRAGHLGQDRPVMDEPLQLGIVQLRRRLTFSGLAGEVAQIDDEIGLPTGHFLDERAKVLFVGRGSPGHEVAVGGYGKTNGAKLAPFGFTRGRPCLQQEEHQKDDRSRGRRVNRFTRSAHGLVSFAFRPEATHLVECGDLSPLSERPERVAGWFTRGLRHRSFFTKAPEKRRQVAALQGNLASLRTRRRTRQALLRRHVGGRDASRKPASCLSPAPELA